MREDVFDRLVEAASKVFNIPFVVINILHEEIEWIKVFACKIFLLI